jgi:transposase
MSVYIGIDWSEQKHDVAFLNEKGGMIERFTIAHTWEGLNQIDTMCQRMGVSEQECLIGIETMHNLLLDHLLSSGFSKIYIIPPSMVKNCRGRFGASKARTDQSDAHLLADIVRTDLMRLHCWQVDSLLTRQIRAQVSQINFLTDQIVRSCNRLRAILLRYYPAALRVFSSLDSAICLAFIQTFSTPEQAAQLSFSDFQTFARQHHYPCPKRLPACFARLQQPCPRPSQATSLIYQPQACLLARVVAELIRAKNTTLTELKATFEDHPDYPIFASLPGAGKFLAPALLAKFGDDRLRFPTPQSLQAVAGTCPVTYASGKRHVVAFRRACDKEFRTIAQQWAMESLFVSSWANSYYEMVLPHVRSKSQAYRSLANRWLAIAWKLWQERIPYNEDLHLRQRALRSLPR